MNPQAQLNRLRYIRKTLVKNRQPKNPGKAGLMEILETIRQEENRLTWELLKPKEKKKQGSTKL